MGLPPETVFVETPFRRDRPERRVARKRRKKSTCQVVEPGGGVEHARPREPLELKMVQRRGRGLETGLGVGGGRQGGEGRARGGARGRGGVRPEEGLDVERGAALRPLRFAHRSLTELGRAVAGAWPPEVVGGGAESAPPPIIPPHERSPAPLDTFLVTR